MTNGSVSELAPNPRRSRQHYAIPHDTFVTEWTLSTTAQEATDRISRLVGVTVPKSIVTAKAAYYRRLGVNLKKMPRESAAS